MGKNKNAKPDEQKVVVNVTPSNAPKAPRAPRQQKQNRKKRTDAVRNSTMGQVNKAARKEVRTLVKAARTPGNGRVASLLSHCLAPGDTPPMRVPRLLGATPVACATPFDTSTPDWKGTGDAGNDLTDSQWAVINFRNALRNRLVWNKNSAHSASTYVAQFYNAAGTINTIPPAAWSAELLNVYQPVPILYWTCQTGKQIHGPTQYLGRAGDKKFTLIQNEASVSATFQNNATAANQAYMKVYEYTGQTEDVEVAMVGIGNGAQSIVWTNNIGTGLYRFEVVKTSAVVGSMSTMTYSINDQQGYFAQLPIPGLVEKLSSVNKTAVTAASLLVSCRGSITNEQGSITQAQIPAGEDWREYMNFEKVASVAKNQQRTGPLMKGGYGVLIPTAVRDFELDTDWSYDSSNVLKSISYDLVEDSDFLVTFCECEQDEGRDLIVYTTIGVDFSTVDPWFECIPCMADEKVLNALVQHLKTAPHFFENPLHLGQIFGYVRKALGFGGRIASLVAPAMGPYGSAVAVGGQIAQSAASLDVPGVIEQIRALRA